MKSPNPSMIPGISISAVTMSFRRKGRPQNKSNESCRPMADGECLWEGEGPTSRIYPSGRSARIDTARQYNPGIIHHRHPTRLIRVRKRALTDLPRRLQTLSRQRLERRHRDRARTYPKSAFLTPSIWNRFESGNKPHVVLCGVRTTGRSCTGATPMGRNSWSWLTRPTTSSYSSLCSAATQYESISGLHQRPTQSGFRVHSMPDRFRVLLAAATGAAHPRLTIDRKNTRRWRLGEIAGRIPKWKAAISTVGWWASSLLVRPMI